MTLKVIWFTWLVDTAEDVNYWDGINQIALMGLIIQTNKSNEKKQKSNYTSDANIDR